MGEPSMKKNTQHFVVFLVTFVFLLMSGCQVADPAQTADGTSNEKQENREVPHYTYTGTVVSFPEPEGAQYSSTGWQVSLGSISIQFTEDISDDDRNTAVAEIARLIPLAEGQVGEISQPCTIRIRSGSYAPWSYAHVLYIGYDELGTQKFTVGLGQMLFGHEVNYGLCYGFGVELAREAGYALEGELTTAEDALALCGDSPLYLDLNYACFLPAYADTETLARVRTLAADLYRFMTPEKRRELLVNYSNELFRKNLNEYLSAYGQESYESDDLDGIYFYPCGSELRLAWEDPCAVFYLFDDYTVAYNPFDLLHGVDDFLNSGYENFRYIAACYRLQAEEMDRIAGYLEVDGKDDKVSVLFVRDAAEERRGAATFNWLDHKIRMFSYHGYAHEYVHYLTRGTASPEAWKKELFTAYFTDRPGDPSLYWSIILSKNTFTSADPSAANGAKLASCFNAVCDSLDRPFDWESPSDFRHLNDAFVVLFDQIPKLQSEANAAVKKSFAEYLVDLAGEEAAMLAVYYGTPVETFGRDWDVLINDWQTKLTNEFVWLKH